MNRVQQEHDFWNAASASKDLRNEWICDKNVTDTECVGEIVDAIWEGVESIKGKTTPTIIELGCGIGRLTSKVADVYQDAVVLGLDISEKILRHATPARNVRYIINDGRTIPEPNGIANAIYSMLLFQHLSPNGVKSYIQEAGRVLDKDGIFFFQFIEGTEQEPFSRHYQLKHIKNCLRVNNLEPIKVSKGLIDENWTWIKAIKK